MTRLEENSKLIDEVSKEAGAREFPTYENVVAFHLTTMAAILADISKSLAVLASK